MSGTPLPLLKWEYARLESTADGVNVVFTHHESWTGIPADAFFDTMRKLGDEGWELVTAVPLAAGAEFEPDSLSRRHGGRPPPDAPAPGDRPLAGLQAPPAP